MEFPSGVTEHARDFVRRSVYSFSDLEKRALRGFFTNYDKRVFFMHSLPANVTATLLAMYSRIKNPRGLRGVFVDNFLPEFLASFLGETERFFGGDALKFLKASNIRSLENFVFYSSETVALFEEFARSIYIDPDYLKKLTESKKTRKFTDTYLDKYGHNSIARPAAFYIGFEQVSILAAKSIEWCRPGSAFIELSTRYVDMSGKDYYPVENELAEYGVDENHVRALIEKEFRLYSEFQGENFSGPFPQHLRETYSHLFSDQKDLEKGVIGETCDVLGNFLPAATLTSLGAYVSGEALPELLKHLYLDNTPENIALAESVIAEGSKVGADQFIRHIEPTEWKRMSWKYLPPYLFLERLAFIKSIYALDLPDLKSAEMLLVRAFSKISEVGKCREIKDVIAMLKSVPRGEHDKLPNQFERISVTLDGIMSFRGWRDVQRQSLCAHFRTHLAPFLGFYKYDKSAPESFHAACRNIYHENRSLYSKFLVFGGKSVPDELAQYPIAIGNMIGFEVSANLLEWEFCNWQRTKYSVNHEVRQVFLAAEKMLREAYPWWSEISRADMTQMYVFARGNKKVEMVQKGIYKYEIKP